MNQKSSRLNDDNDCGVKIVLTHGDDCSGCQLMKKIVLAYAEDENKLRREQMWDAGYVVGKAEANKPIEDKNG